MRKAASRICSVLGLLLIVAVILICLPLTAPRLMGYEVYAIVSGSMEPAIPVGSLIYAKAIDDPEAVETGDVIVFQGGPGSEGVAVTHRVVENQREQEQFITKGDANAAEDVSPVGYRQVLGQVGYTVPALGYFLPAVSTMQGKLSLLGVLAAAVLLRVVGGLLKRPE